MRQRDLPAWHLNLTMSVLKHRSSAQVSAVVANGGLLSGMEALDYIAD